MSLGLVGLSYKERLVQLDLYSLEFRRTRGDLFEVYKMIRGIDKVEVKECFLLKGNLEQEVIVLG